jgi:hypothetical protein
MMKKLRLKARRSQNEARTRQAIGGLKEMFHKDGLLTPPVRLVSA